MIDDYVYRSGYWGNSVQLEMMEETCSVVIPYVDKKSEEQAMTKFKRQRKIWRGIGIISGLIIILSIIFSWHHFINIVFGTVLIVDIVMIAVKNRCPFCHKNLRIAPMEEVEYCPNCGCKIE